MRSFSPRLLTSSARYALLAALSIIGCAWLVTGCADLFDPFVPGEYTGDLDCTIHAVTATGSEGQEDFTAPTTLVIGEDGGFTVNGDAIIVGQEVLRAIPNADLAFEVLTIVRAGDVVTVTYEPRPSLPGITVEGTLVETYRWEDGAVVGVADADLIATDVSGPNTFEVDCQGELLP